MRTYNLKRGAKVETVLFIALHRHYARLLKRSLEKTFKYTAEQQRLIADYSLFQSPESSRKMRLLMAKIHELTEDEKDFIRELIDTKQNVEKIASKRQWSIPFTQQRIDELRAVLKGAV